MDYITLVLGGLWYAVFIVSTVLHEAAHGLAAKKLGDPTAHRHGLVTVDPIPHIKRSPFGMVIVPIVSFVFNGWMLGWASAPYDPYWAQCNRKKAAWMSLAGPAANLGLLIIAGLLIRLGMQLGSFSAPESITFTRITTAEPNTLANSAAITVSIFFSLNLILLVFNLIPLPPLDGSGVLMLFLSDRAAEKYQAALSQPGVRVMGLVGAWYLIGVLLPPMQGLALMILYPGLVYR